MVKSVLRGLGRPGLEPGTNALKGRWGYLKWSYFFRRTDFALLEEIDRPVRTSEPLSGSVTDCSEEFEHLV